MGTTRAAGARRAVGRDVPVRRPVSILGRRVDSGQSLSLTLDHITTLYESVHYSRWVVAGEEVARVSGEAV